MKNLPLFRPQKAGITPLSVILALIFISGGCRSVQNASLTRSGSVFTQEPAVRVTATNPAPTVHTSSETVAASTPIASRWPTRWGDNPDMPGTIIDLDPAEPLRPIHLSRFHQHRTTDVEYKDAADLARAVGIENGFKFKAEGPGSFLFVPNPRNIPNLDIADITQDSGVLKKSNIPDLAFKFVSATPITTESDATNPGEDHVAIQRTWFTYKDPKLDPENSDIIQGTIVLLPGMFGTPDPIVDALERFWQSKGYAILRMRSQPSRFTEHEMIEVDAGKEPAIALQAAAINDDRVAEAAYATKAAFDHLMALRSDLADKPTILVGMSGGAMLLPTIFAYSPDYYDAAVLIAGGANFIRIAIESNYKSWIDSIVFDFKPSDPKSEGTPTKEQVNAMSQHYLMAAKLDAYHTATEMTDIPVLMLHASADKAVPSSTGRLLYQQLGEPERWSYPLGHELIFVGLPTQVSRIDRWITKHVLSESPSD